MAISMVRFNEFVDVGYQSYSKQYQLGKGLKKFGEKGHKASSSELEQLHHGQQPRESKAWKEAQVYLVGMAVQECVDGKTELDNIRFVG